MKAVMLSIRPAWCEKIAQGRKTIEVRKTSPKLQPPFKCYIYCTERGRPLVYGDVQCWGGYREEYTQTYGYSKEEARKIWDVYNGHVMGEFVCDYILDLRPPYKGKTEGTCLEAKELYTYAGERSVLYGWHISDLVIYDTPKELMQYKVECDKNCEDCAWWLPTRVNADEIDMECASPVYALKPLTRPPQSWCYVEELT